jgi:putative cardiolipin synthase
MEEFALTHPLLFRIPLFHSALRTCAWTLFLALVTACTTLPTNVDRMPSNALADTAATTLGRALAPRIAAHPGQTGVHPLREGREAFAARHRLAAAAERSLDVQYYIWHNDTSGSLLAHALWNAAERGVRVRMLLDDANTRGMDPLLAALDSHALVEVRLFNPFMHRTSRIVNFMGDFSRLNRRMHNKLYIADNQVAIVGGRNIGDEYLGATTSVEFADLDVVAAGAVVADVSASFDAYWNSASAYPAAAIMATTTPAAGRAEIEAQAAALKGDAKANDFLEAVRTSVAVPQMMAGGHLEWTNARLLADDPAKVLHPPDRSEMHMLPRLKATLGDPQEEMLLVSPYFVPTRQGTDALAAVAARGVRVSVLTNSLAATDVAPAYAGYAKYRHDLLRSGVRLYELKRTSPKRKLEQHEGLSAGGSSGASLHAKTFAVDRKRIFIGSFNLDPRSARLNTESGLVLESPMLAADLSARFGNEIREGAYEVRLDETGQGLVWIERSGGTEVRHTSAPETGFLRRVWTGFLGWLPIEWML